MRKISLFVIFSIILTLIMPMEKMKADEVYDISFPVTYGQSDARLMFEMINELRATATDGLSNDPLEYDYGLEKVAMQRAAELVIKCMDTRPDGSSYLSALGEAGFDISPRGILYGENYVFGTLDSMTVKDAFDQLCKEQISRENMIGGYLGVGIGHIRIEDNIDFWVQIFATDVSSTPYNAPNDSEGIATVKIPASLVGDVEIEYQSGNANLAAGETIQAPVYIPKVRIIGSELDEKLKLAPLAFESSDGIISAANGMLTGLSEGQGTITAQLLGKSYSYPVTVAKGSNIITATPTPTPVTTPVSEPTSIPTQAVTPTAEPTNIPTQVTTPSPEPTSVPTPTQKVNETDTKELKKGDIFEIDNLKYRVLSSGKVEVIGSTDKKQVKIVIPETVKKSGKKFKVTGIAKAAFSGYTSLTNVTVGKNVSSIGLKAFYGCKKLNVVTIKSKKIKSIGKAAFLKTNKKIVLYVPQKNNKSYKKLLKTSGLGKKAKIVNS